MVRPIVDLASINLTEAIVTESELREALPQDHEFRLIDAICFLDLEERIAVGYKDWNANPWWARGHVPGRPLMPGVLMIEGCAQVAAILVRKSDLWNPDQLIGLGGIDNARFRRMITPPARVYFVAHMARQTRRIARYPAQCIVGGEIALDAELMGVPL